MSLDAEQHWRVVDGQRYTLTTELKLPLGMKSRRYVSRGQITEAGLESEQYEEYPSGSSSPTHVARVDRLRGELHYGAPDKLRQIRLEPALQDMNGLSFQLAFWPAAGNATVWPVTNGKGVVRYRFDAAAAGRFVLQAREIDVQRQVGHSSDGQIEVWSAPSLARLPVQVVRSQDGRQLTFTARQIRFTP